MFLRDGYVEQLSTYMTGELFAMLGGSGTLAALMAQNASGNEQDGHDEHDGAFRAGMLEALQRKPLTHSLFGVRARVVSKAMPASAARSFVSGLLIGTEFVAAQGRDGTTIHLIASTALSGRYAYAAGQFGLQARVLDPDTVYLAALQRFFTD